MHMVEMLFAKHQIFGGEPPVEPPTPEEERKYLEIDSFSRQRMMLKLLDVEKQHLFLALNYVAHTKGEESAVERTARLDLFVRYQTTARREFYRALNEYERHKEAQ
jgi:hypothetical protein